MLRSSSLIVITFVVVSLANPFSPAYADQANEKKSAPFFTLGASAEVKHYQQEYEVDDFVLTQKPENRTYQLNLGIGKDWGVSVSRFVADDTMSEIFPVPEQPNRNAQLFADYELETHSLSLTRYFKKGWLSLAFTQTQDNQLVRFRGPGKAFEVIDENQIQTFSLGAGRSQYLGDWLLGGHLYLDRQTATFDSSLRKVEGNLSLQSVSSEQFTQTDDGYIGTAGVSLGYEFYGKNWLVYPEMTVSHTRTLDGQVDQFQQSNQRWTRGDENRTFSDEGASVSEADADPVTAYTLSISSHWRGYTVHTSRQRIQGQSSKFDVSTLSIGFAF